VVRGAAMAARVVSPTLFFFQSLLPQYSPTGQGPRSAQRFFIFSIFRKVFHSKGLLHHCISRINYYKRIKDEFKILVFLFVSRRRHRTEALALFLLCGVVVDSDPVV
jgi:hypothetical protein